MHYEKVNRISCIFFHFFIFIIIEQNICFFLFYVNLIFHIWFLWIMWITLCITQFPREFRHFEMWITFAPKSTLSTFFDKFCAICQTTDFYCFSSSKLLSHIFFCQCDTTLSVSLHLRRFNRKKARGAYVPGLYLW